MATLHSVKEDFFNGKRLNLLTSLQRTLDVVSGEKTVLLNGEYALAVENKRIFDLAKNKENFEAQVSSVFSTEYGLSRSIKTTLFNGSIPLKGKIQESFLRELTEKESPLLVFDFVRGRREMLLARFGISTGFSCFLFGNVPKKSLVITDKGNVSFMNLVKKEDLNKRDALFLDALMTLSIKNSLAETRNKNTQVFLQKTMEDFLSAWEGA